MCADDKSASLVQAKHTFPTKRIINTSQNQHLWNCCCVTNPWKFLSARKKGVPCGWNTCFFCVCSFRSECIFSKIAFRRRETLSFSPKNRPLSHKIHTFTATETVMPTATAMATGPERSAAKGWKIMCADDKSASLVQAKHTFSKKYIKNASQNQHLWQLCCVTNQRKFLSARKEGAPCGWNTCFFVVCSCGSDCIFSKIVFCRRETLSFSKKIEPSHTKHTLFECDFQYLPARGDRLIAL